jgi:hypothetical protein
MTTPSGGYPDFQSSVQWKGAKVSAPSQGYPFGVTDLSFINLTNFASLGLSMRVPAGNLNLILTFWADQAKTVKVDTYTIPVVSGTTVDLLVPAVASWVDISIDVQTGGGATVIYNFTPSNVPTNELSYVGPPQLLFETAKTLAASASSITNPFYLIPGPAYFEFLPYDALGKLQVDINTITATGGAGARILRQNGPTAELFRNIILPCAPVQVTITNTDAGGPHEYDMALIANGG